MLMGFRRPIAWPGAPQWLFGAILLVLNLPNFFWLESNGDFLINGYEFGERLFFGLLLGAISLTLFTRP